MTPISVDQAMQAALQYQQAGKYLESETLCRQILAVSPHHAQALNLLGILAWHAGQPDIARQLIQRAIAAQPRTAEFYSNLGNILRAAGAPREAVAAYQAALEIDPTPAEVHSNLGCALASQEQFDQAIASFQRALALKPQLAQAHSNLGNALLDLGKAEQAIAAYRAAVALAPDAAEVQFNLAMALLLCGYFEEGWRAYEWRLKCADEAQQTRLLADSRWNGEDLAGRTLLLHAEQGFGDTIQFIRYAKPAAARGGKIIVACRRELIGLLSQLPYVERFVPSDEPSPAFHVHCPLLSLPMIFGTTLATIPPQDPPLNADIAKADSWRPRLAPLAGQFKIGLAWTGSPGNKRNPQRSIPFALLERLGELPNVQLISLQKGLGETDAANSPHVLNAAADLHDFSDTAALIANLDLIITADTAVGHLAGAMHKPVWLLLHFAPDWRWLLNRLDTPWYPTMRLFRQPLIRDWDAVIDRVIESLRNHPCGSRLKNG